jgi:hypothetical protein
VVGERGPLAHAGRRCAPHRGQRHTARPRGGEVRSNSERGGGIANASVKPVFAINAWPAQRSRRERKRSRHVSAALTRRTSEGQRLRGGGGGAAAKGHVACCCRAAHTLCRHRPKDVRLCSALPAPPPLRPAPAGGEARWPIPPTPPPPRFFAVEGGARSSCPVVLRVC